MKRIKKLAAIWLSKTAIIVSKVLGKKGSAGPGGIALKIYPTILSDLSQMIKKEIIVVCGTNGKTTTNNMLHHILSSKGYKVVCNKVGANMPDGITTAFIEKATIWGKIDADYACIEVDEAYAEKAFDYFKPSKIIITNLFKDQLDRYGEADSTIKMLKKALEKVPDACLILNADDPMTAQFGHNNGKKNFYFGIDDNIENKEYSIKNTYLCTICGNKLNYNYYHYNQLGDFHCSHCDFRRPLIDFKAYGISFGENMRFNVDSGSCTAPFDVGYKGFYNIYNIIAATAAAILLGVDIDHINNAFHNYTPELGRMETFKINKPVILNLSKNAAGFNQAIETIAKEQHSKDIMIVINDSGQDGKDISWIWDIDFESLAKNNINSYTISGTRKEDLAVRFKYAGINNNKINVYNDIKSAVKNAIAQTGKTCYILVNYTALFTTQKILKEFENKARKN